MEVRTFSLGSGADTVVFAKTDNGEDTITGFTAGSGGDKLAVGGVANGLLGAAFVSSKFTTASGSGDLSSTGSGTQVLIHSGNSKIDITAGSSNTSFKTNGGSTDYKIGSSQKLFVVDTVNNTNILYLVDEGGGSLTVTKVGTLNAGSAIASTLTADNFGDVA